MHRDVTLDKIGYMMARIGDCELSVDDLESMIHKVFVSSFELEHGFEADLIRELVDARAALIEADAEDDKSPEYLNAKQAEEYYLECQKNMYVQAGYTADYGMESASWPDSLPLLANWDKKFLRELARKEVAHHLVVLDQIRAEMAKRVDSNS